MLTFTGIFQILGRQGEEKGRLKPGSIRTLPGTSAHSHKHTQQILLIYAESIALPSHEFHSMSKNLGSEGMPKGLTFTDLQLDISDGATEGLHKPCPTVYKNEMK